MAKCSCRARSRPTAEPASGSAPLYAEMEEEITMNRYISPCSLLTPPCPSPCRDSGCCAERALLEQLVEFSASQNQLLVDILGAINSLTAALLSQQLRL